MFPIVVWFVLSLALYGVAAALQNKNQPPVQEPGKLDIPTVEEGKTVGIVYGKVRIKNPSIVWWGDVRTFAIVKEGGKK